VNRRQVLKACAVLMASAIAAPLRALASAWNKPAFDSKDVDGALQGLGVHHIGPSRDIILTAPDMAENGAIVQIEVESHIPNTEAISIMVDKNPTPLIANFVFSNGALPAIITRIKMAETSELKAIVKADGKYYSVGRKVEVALGGCG
jgi:sulfur-oxidizing protein SoxY